MSIKPHRADYVEETDMANDTLFRQGTPRIMSEFMGGSNFKDLQVTSILGNIKHEWRSSYNIHGIGQPGDESNYEWSLWTGPLKYIFTTLFLLLFIFSTAFATGNQELPMDKVNTLASRKVLTFDGRSFPFTGGIIAGRYMEDDVKGGCKDTMFPNWEGFPLKKCTYNQPDRSSPKRIKTATVIMLNPNKEVLAKWIIASCLIVKKNMDIDACTNKLAYRIIDASGSQFAVAGIVLEDLHPKGGDGIQEAYTFRDGVTVSVQDGISVGFTGMFSEKENGIALDPTKKVLSTASDDGPARIQNTTRKMYQDYLGNKAKDVKGTKWLDVVRELYQDAWKRAYNSALPETVEKYRNDLMVAKCYSLMGVKSPK